MKQIKQKQLLAVAISVVVALAVFLILLLLFNWNLFLSMALALVVYFAVSLVLKPTQRIGNVDVSTLKNGDVLMEKLGEAGKDYGRLNSAASQIHDVLLYNSARELAHIAESILTYLIKNPKKIASAKRYIDYYQGTAANILEHHVALQEACLPDDEMKKAVENTKEAVATLKSAFQLQFQKLMQNELADMEADLNSLKKSLNTEDFDTVKAENE